MLTGDLRPVKVGERFNDMGKVSQSVENFGPQTLPVPVQMIQESEKIPVLRQIDTKMTYYRRRALSEGLKWDRWCFFPLHMYIKLLCRDHNLGDFRDFVENENFGPALEWWALLTWRQTKGIYRFDQTTLEYAASTKLKDLPTEILLRLPEWCVYVETPGVLGNWTGFFALLTNSGLDQRPLLFVIGTMGVSGDLLHKCIVLDLSKRTVEESIEGYFINSPHITPDKRADDMAKTGKVLGILTYLCSVEREIVHSSGNPNRKPRNPRPGDIPKDRGKTSDTWNVWKTGYRMGGKIREAEATEWQGGTKRAHIRTAHIHHYWIGPNHPSWIGPIDDPKARHLVGFWLPVINVNVRTPEDIRPTVREIKKKEEVFYEKETEID